MASRLCRVTRNVSAAMRVMVTRFVDDAGNSSGASPLTVTYVWPAGKDSRTGTVAVFTTYSTESYTLPSFKTKLSMAQSASTVTDAMARSAAPSVREYGDSTCCTMVVLTDGELLLIEHPPAAEVFAKVRYHAVHKFPHPSNAMVEMLVTLLGIVTLVRPLQF